MVLCNYNCQFNKEGFCTKEILRIRYAQGIPVCEIMVKRDGTIAQNEFIDRKTKDLIIEEGKYEPFTADIAEGEERTETEGIEESSNHENTDTSELEEMFDT